MLPAVTEPPSAQIENLKKLSTVPRAIATAISASIFVSDPPGLSVCFSIEHIHLRFFV
jgi:hypothetical protein